MKKILNSEGSVVSLVCLVRYGKAVSFGIGSCKQVGGLGAVVSLVCLVWQGYDIQSVSEYQHR